MTMEYNRVHSQVRSQGGVGGVPIHPPETNDIHNFNYVIQEGHLIVCSPVSEPQIAPEAL